MGLELWRLPISPAARIPAAGSTREAGMTQQAAFEATPAQPTLAGDEQAVRDRAGAGNGAEALVVDELLVEEVSIDGMCGVY
jgi:mycofactocin precursor